MNLYLRLLHLLLLWRFRPRLALFEEARTPFRVWPLDLDLNLHLNNGRYLTLMDLARIDLMLRNGWARDLRRAGMFPVVAGQTIRYAKSIGPFRRFEIVSDVVGWDERAFFVRQRFVSRGEIAAQAVIRGVFLQRGKGRVSTAEVLAAAGVAADSPTIPDWVVAWQASDAAGWETVPGQGASASSTG